MKPLIKDTLKEGKPSSKQIKDKPNVPLYINSVHVTFERATKDKMLGPKVCPVPLYILLGAS